MSNHFQGNRTGVAFLIVALIIVVAGYFILKGFNTTGDIGEVIEESAENMNIDTDELLSPEDGNKKKAAKAANANSEIVVKEGNPVVAKVDGKDITRVDVYRFIQTMPANIQQLPAATVYPMAMDQVINTRIVQNKAEANNIQETEEFKRELDIAKQQIARNLFLQQSVDQKISDGDVKKAYNNYVKKIPNVEERRARHILVETEDKAKAVLKKLETEDTSFAELAKSLSIGPTAPNGGDLGYFTEKEMVPAFSKAAYGLKKGDVIKTPVQTQFGWHVIKLEDIRNRPNPTLEQLTPSLKAELRREKLEELLQDWRADSSIQQFDINGDALKKGADATGLVREQAQ